MVALKGKGTIGDDINKKIIARIAEENQLTGTIDVADFNNADKPRLSVRMHILQHKSGLGEMLAAKIS